MPPEDADAPLRKLSLIVYSGAFDKVHYALATASAAIAIDIPVTLFFTMDAIRCLTRNASGEPGWHTVAAGDGTPGHEADGRFAARGVATFEELLSACVELGVTFMVCEMGLRAVHLSATDLREDVPFREGGLVTFLRDARADGAVVFV